MKKVDYKTVEFKKKNLNMIKRINNKVYTERKYILLGMLKQYYSDFKESEITYHIPFTSDTKHIEHYNDLAKSYKSKALGDITDAYKAISSNHLKEAEVLLNRLIDTEFYTNDVNKLIGKWQTKTRSKKIEISYKRITV